MATSMCRVRPLFARLNSFSFDNRILLSKSLPRTNIAISISCVSTYSRKICSINLATKNQVLCRAAISVSRFFCTDKKLATEEISEKVLHVCKTFDKIPVDKLTIDSHFMNDLGLDSLDHVELIMNIEDDFNFEIPDGDAERLLRPSDIVAYIEQKQQASATH